jgi:hypothetical protein
MDAQEVSEAVVPVGESITNPISAPCSASEQKRKTPLANPTQDKINAEALAIAKRLVQRHVKTWKELAKY